MSLDAYIQRQDRTFDTFRAKFNNTAASQPAPPEIRSCPVHTSEPEASKGRGRTISSATFRELLVSIDQDEKENGVRSPIEPEVASPHDSTTQLTFAPQMRKLALAPWEVSDKENATEEPKKAKRPRKGFFSKFKRRGPLSSGPGESLARCSEDLRQTETLSTITSTDASPASLADEFVRADPAEQIQVRKDIPTAAAPVSQTDSTSELRGRLIPAGLPLGAQVDSSIAFRPVDPNILFLKQPMREVITEDGKIHVMKPSISTPQIQYECDSPRRVEDRMSRMFDKLKFDANAGPH